MTPGPAAGTAGLGRWRPWAAAAAIALPALAVLRLSLHRFYQMDEFVFVRCAWLVAGGSVPYRDFFDHHTPLFYVLLAPLIAAAPESPAALTWARLATWVLLAAVVALAGRLAWRLGGAAGAWLAVLLLATFNGYIARGIEVRPDLLATFAFAGCAALLVAGPAAGAARVATAGALATLAALSTQKSVYYLWGLGVLLLLDLAAALRRRPGPRLLGRPGLFAAGALAPAALFAALLAATGALPAFWQQNVTLALDWQATELTFPVGRYLTPLLLESPHWFLLVAAGAAAMVLEPTARARTAPRERLIYLALAGPALLSLWVNPIPWPYNFLPVFTILAPLTALVPVALAGRLGRTRSLRVTALLGCLALALFAVQAAGELRRDNRRQRAVLARVLELTEPGQAIFDTNGGYLFRPAAYRYWYHSAAMRDLLRAEFAASTVAEVRDAGATVWIYDDRFPDLPDSVREFFHSSYLRHSGPIFLWGGAYRSPAGGSEQRFEFEAVRDGLYFLESGDGAPAAGIRAAVDGRPIAARRPFRLTRGLHELTLERAEAAAPWDFFILWLPADGRPWHPLPGRPPRYYPHFF